MADVTTEQVKALRDQTSISIMQCKKALEEAGGDIDKAKIILEKKGSSIAEKKAGRELGAGAVQAYIHNTKDVGAMVVLACETDFVAKNEEFTALAYSIAMHVVATNPLFLKKEDITDESMQKAKEVFAKETEEEVKGKPKELQDKILQGKLDSYFEDKILLEQPFIKDPNTTIQALIESATQKFGEKIELTKFIRFSARG